MSDAEHGPHIVRDFFIGNTHIMIADDCCRDKTPEDVQRILKKIAMEAQAAISAAALKNQVDMKNGHTSFRRGRSMTVEGMRSATPHQHRNRHKTDTGIKKAATTGNSKQRQDTTRKRPKPL